MMQAVAIPITSTLKKTKLQMPAKCKTIGSLPGKHWNLLIASVRTNLAKGRVLFSLFDSFAYQASGRLERCISEFF